ncbi:MAG TPA: ABC transporter substrate-binding protein [Candidatus Methylomirabilis sp.]
MNRRWYALPVVAPVLVAALCAAPVPAGGQAVRVRLGTSLAPPSSDVLTPYVAVERGFFASYGLDVQVIAFRGGAINMKALLAGEADVSVLGATDAIVSAAKGARIRTWMVPHPVLPFHFVARKDSAATLQALVGKNIAVSGIGTISHHIPRIVLQRSGLDPEKVKYIALGSPADRFKALLAGKVDATLVTNMEAAKLARHPEIIDLAQVSKVVPEVPYEFGVAKEDYIEKNLEPIYGLTRALLEAGRWMAANKVATVEIAKKVLREEPPDVLERAYDLADPRQWGVNGDISEAAYNYTVDFLLKVGYLKDPVPLEKLFDRRFVDRALRELGRM